MDIRMPNINIRSRALFLLLILLFLLHADAQYRRLVQKPDD